MRSWSRWRREGVPAAQGLEGRAARQAEDRLPGLCREASVDAVYAELDAERVSGAAGRSLQLYGRAPPSGEGCRGDPSPSAHPRRALEPNDAAARGQQNSGGVPLCCQGLFRRRLLGAERGRRGGLYETAEGIGHRRRGLRSSALDCPDVAGALSFEAGQDAVAWHNQRLQGTRLVDLGSVLQPVAPEDVLPDVVCRPQRDVALQSQRCGGHHRHLRRLVPRSQRRRTPGCPDVDRLRCSEDLWDSRRLQRRRRPEGLGGADARVGARHP
mmetsp:Transcript_105212/g.304342  ORF Transcript_105212/g.304342 Transcript_105212/m.304342 type:complete len:270 (+) Transcript_105212:370-1179(+)